jgi:hypothetical protein
MSEKVNAKTLADRLGVSKGRVSQLVGEGVLDGCFTGVGLARRFDVAQVAERLNRRLDQAQQLGNGARAAAARAEVLAPTPAAAPTAPTPTAAPAAPAPSLTVKPADEDNDRYRAARAEQAEIDTILKRRRLAEEEGRWVLAEEAASATRRALAAEIAEVEAMLREGARRMADELGVDARAAKVILLSAWRDHRAVRSARAAHIAETVTVTDTEAAELETV